MNAIKLQINCHDIILSMVDRRKIFNCLLWNGRKWKEKIHLMKINTNIPIQYIKINSHS